VNGWETYSLEQKDQAEFVQEEFTLQSRMRIRCWDAYMHTCVHVCMTMY